MVFNRLLLFSLCLVFSLSTQGEEKATEEYDYTNFDEEIGMTYNLITNQAQSSTKNVLDHATKAYLIKKPAKTNPPFKLQIPEHEKYVMFRVPISGKISGENWNCEFLFKIFFEELIAGNQGPPSVSFALSYSHISWACEGKCNDEKLNFQMLLDIDKHKRATRDGETLEMDPKPIDIFAGEVEINGGTAKKIKPLGKKYIYDGIKYNNWQYTDNDNLTPTFRYMYGIEEGSEIALNETVKFKLILKWQSPSSSPSSGELANTFEMEDGQWKSNSEIILKSIPPEKSWSVKNTHHINSSIAHE